ncbi:MAG: RagB/SusD family nutrient uptake outer membrane protein, partial [Bacteroidota bacterium]
MKKLSILFLFGMLLITTACNNDLDQFPTNIASSGSLTDYAGVLNAAYFYQHASVTPMAVMGDFRADNAFMYKVPQT